MSEQALWETLRGLVPRGQYSRIESPDTAPGFPDVQYQLRGPTVSGTIELKVSRHRVGVPFRNEDEGLHLSQKIWIKENVANGGICWVAARVNDKLYWVHGRFANEFNGREYLSQIATCGMDLNKIRPNDTKNINFMLRGILV